MWLDLAREKLRLLKDNINIRRKYILHYYKWAYTLYRGYVLMSQYGKVQVCMQLVASRYLLLCSMYKKRDCPSLYLLQLTNQLRPFPCKYITLYYNPSPIYNNYRLYSNIMVYVLRFQCNYWTRHRSRHLAVNIKLRYINN